MLFVVAYNDQAEIVGAGALSILTTEHKKTSESTTSADLHQIGVLPSEQGRGYGKAIMNVCEEISRDQGATHLTLDILDDSEQVVDKLRQIYQKLGYTQNPESPEEYIKSIG